jgi:hypothetical protein
MAVLSWAITALVGGWLLAFVLALLSLRSIPLGERPRTATYDRFGRFLGLRENPDYHEQPGEDRAAADEP